MWEDVISEVEVRAAHCCRRNSARVLVGRQPAEQPPQPFYEQIDAQGETIIHSTLFQLDTRRENVAAAPPAPGLNTIGSAHGWLAWDPHALPWPLIGHPYPHPWAPMRAHELNSWDPTTSWIFMGTQGQPGPLGQGSESRPWEPVSKAMGTHGYQSHGRGS